MNFVHAAKEYLSEIATAVSRLSWMVTFSTSDEVGRVPTVIITMLELEQSTADFIAEVGLDSVLCADMRTCRKFFLHANEEVVEHIEKLQLQGTNFDELQTALKLENETLRKEIDFS